MYRVIEKYSPTLLIDEADTFLRDNEELRGIINSGHQRSSAFVVRTVGENHEPKQFSTWGPKALAQIGPFPPTIEDRAISVSMKRKAPGERVERYSERKQREYLANLRRMCFRWSSDNAAGVRDYDPEDLPSLHDRANDNWRPLLAIADIADGEWSERARRSAKMLSGFHNEEGESVRSQVLVDIKNLFEEAQTDRLSSQEIVEALGKMEERPWPEWRRENRLPLASWLPC